MPTVSPEPENVEDHITEVDELLVRPGTYFNPQTEVLVIVDDSASIDQTIFNMEAYEGAEWVHIADECPGRRGAARRPAARLPDPLPPREGRSVSESDLAADDEEIDEAELDDDEPLVEGESEPRTERTR